MVARGSHIAVLLGTYYSEGILPYWHPKSQEGMVDYLPTRLASNRGTIKLAKKRDTSRYTLWDGQKKVYIGITTDKASRENSHRQDKNFDQMKIEGPKVSRETALQWEQEALDKYRRGHSGKPPKYNE
jgi:predicted GIY-YIG superfamily endonuclease